MSITILLVAICLVLSMFIAMKVYVGFRARRQPPVEAPQEGEEQSRLPSRPERNMTSLEAAEYVRDRLNSGALPSDIPLGITHLNQADRALITRALGSQTGFSLAAVLRQRAQQELLAARREAATPRSFPPESEEPAQDEPAQDEPHAAQVDGGGRNVKL